MWSTCSFGIALAMQCKVNNDNESVTWFWTDYRGDNYLHTAKLYTNSRGAYFRTTVGRMYLDEFIRIQ